MSGKLHRFYREAMSRWAVAFPGCNGKVKELARKGTGAARGRPPRGQAGLRGSRVRPNEAGINRRETSPLPRNILLSPEIGPRAETGQRTTARATVRCRGRALLPPIPKAARGDLFYPLVGRESAERGLGCRGNHHLNSLVESCAGNVGGWPRKGKVSSPPKAWGSVGGFRVLGARERRVQGEGSQEAAVPEYSLAVRALGRQSEPPGADCERETDDNSQSNREDGESSSGEPVTRKRVRRVRRGA